MGLNSGPRSLPYQREVFAPLSGRGTARFSSIGRFGAVFCHPGGAGCAIFKKKRIFVNGELFVEEFSERVFIFGADFVQCDLADTNKGIIFVSL